MEFEVIVKMIIAVIILFILSIMAYTAYGYYKGSGLTIETRNLACDQVGSSFNERYLSKNADYCYTSEFADNFGTCPVSEKGILNAKKTGKYISQTQAGDGVWCCVYAKKGRNSCKTSKDIGASTSETSKSKPIKEESPILNKKVSNGETVANDVYDLDKITLENPLNFYSGGSFGIKPVFFTIKKEGNKQVPFYEIYYKTSRVADINNYKVSVTLFPITFPSETKVVAEKILRSIDKKFIVPRNSRFYNTLQEATNEAIK